MKKSKASVWLFAAAGILLAAAALLLCLTQREAAPRMLVPSSGATKCVEEMVMRLCTGDFAGASAYLYGNPQLDAQGVRSTEVAQQIWDAFTGSVQCSMDGDAYATASGVSQNVVFSSLEVPSVTAAVKERAESLISQRVAEAENMSDIYNENHEYQEAFIADVLRDAAAAAIADGTVRQQSLTLNLVHEKGQWWIMPDQALLDAISGGILK